MRIEYCSLDVHLRTHFVGMKLKYTTILAVSNLIYQAV